MNDSYENCPASNSYVTINVPELEDVTQIIRYDTFVALLFKHDTDVMMKLHAALGAAGEAGELVDAIKKEIIYGNQPNRKNIVEELGDLRFYLQAVMMLYKIPEQEVLEYNANKLSVRYKNLQYSNEAAINRADKYDDPEKS